MPFLVLTRVSVWTSTALLSADFFSRFCSPVCKTDQIHLHLKCESINLESIPEIGPKLVAPSHFFGGIKNEIFLLPRALHSGEKLVVRWPEEWDRASYLDKITLKYAQAANFSSSQRARQLFFLSGLYTCTCVQTATPPHTNSRAQLCWGAKALESFAKLVVGPSII